MRLRPEMAVGSQQRQHADDHARICCRCQAAVYFHDAVSQTVAKALCVQCFAALLEQQPTDEKLILMLPPGLTPQAFIAILRSGQRPATN